MGLGSQEPRKKIFYLSMRATKDKKTHPHFLTQTRENGQTVTLPDETGVSGYLTKIGHSKYEYPENSGKFVPTIELYLVDGGAMFKVSSSVNTNMARGLMNKIISASNWETISLRLYEKNGFPNLWVGNNNEGMGWKYDYRNDLEPLIQTMPDPQDPNATVKIYHKVNELLLNEWIKCERLVLENAKNNPNIKAALLISDGSTPSSSQTDGPPDDPTEHMDDGTKQDLKDFIPPPSDDSDLPF